MRPRIGRGRRGPAGVPTLLSAVGDGPASATISLGSGFLSVNWTPPAAGTVTGYTVRVTPSGGSTTTTTVASTARRLDVESTTAGTSYSATVTATVGGVETSATVAAAATAVTLAEPTVGTTGPRRTMTSVTPPAYYNGDSYANGVRVGNTITFTGLSFTSGIVLYGSGTGPLTTLRFVDCYIPSVSSNGSLPNAEFDHCEISSGVFAYGAAGLIDRCNIYGRSTPFQYQRYGTNNAPLNSVVSTPWTIRDSILHANGPLISGDHCEAFHWTGGKDVQILRNSLVVPQGSFTTGVWNIDGSYNDGLTVGENWLEGGNPTYKVIQDGLNILYRNNRIRPGAAGSTAPGKFVAVSGNVPTYTGNVWDSDGTAITGW